MAFARLVICLCVITVASSCLIWIAYVHSGVWQTHLRQRIENSFSSTQERTDWVRFHVQGREIVLFGEAPSGDALRAVQALIRTAAGVGKLAHCCVPGHTCPAAGGVGNLVAERG